MEKRARFASQIIERVSVDGKEKHDIDTHCTEGLTGYKIGSKLDLHVLVMIKQL